MAYDEGLAQRVQEVLDGMGLPGFEAKRMFGGVGYMVQGNMACGVHKESLIVRVGPDGYAEALSMPHTREFDITGRPMKGWVMVDADGYASDADLYDWVQRGVAFALKLEPK
jgi:hypothetical protein